MEDIDIFLEEFEGYQVKCLDENCEHRATFMDKNKALNDRELHKQENESHQVIVSFHEYEADSQVAEESSEIIKLEEIDEEKGLVERSFAFPVDLMEKLRSKAREDQVTENQVLNYLIDNMEVKEE